MHRTINVSVVIPCFNDGRYLQETLDSVFKQTSDDWEVIIVDDCSTDPNTHETIQLIRDERVRVFRNIRQSGPAAARNLAISHAAGKYILPLDADDRIRPTYIEKARGLLDASQELEIVYCQATLFGLSRGEWVIPPFRPETFVLENTIFSSAFFRRATWEKVGGFSENMTEGMEDYDFWIKIISRGGQVRRIEEHLFEYRIKRGSRTASLLARQREKEFQAFSKLIENNIQYFSRPDNVRTIFFELRKRMLKERELTSSLLWSYCFRYLVGLELIAKSAFKSWIRGS